MHSIVKAFLVAAAVVNALPASQLEARQAGGRTLVPGLTFTGTTPPVRKEIRSLSATELNIYYLALEAMQALPISDMKSFYRVAGIHGTNYRWDGDTGGQFSDLTYGYCRHADRAFPTWHRPYLSLYEKTLYDLATAAIAKWPAGAQKTDHQKALETWRAPYWDWAADPSIPAIMGGTAASERVQITKQDASGRLGTYTVHNPVYSYIFPRENENGVNRIVTSSNERVNTKESVRNPEVKSNYYVNRPEYTNSEMVEAGPNMKTYVFNMFSRVTDYNRMSNMQEGELSLEGVHGTVHIVVGGLQSDREIPGHMTDPAIAGFDPIFFLHHMNVDRLFALWQAINPNSYIGNSGLPAAATELHPFRRTANQYWTSTSSRDVKAFGYTYPELTKPDVKGQVAALYGRASPARAVADATKLARKMKRSDFIFKRQDNGENDNLHTPPNTEDLAQHTEKVINSTTPAGEPQTYNEYVANIKAPNTAADGSYKVFIFLGEPTSAAADYTKDNNFVGSFDIFAPSGLMAAHQKTVQGSVTLTNAFLNLIASQKIADMKPKTVRGYLKENLIWKVTSEESTQTSQIGINVVTAKVTVPQGENQLPQWGPFSHVYKAK